MNIGLYILIFFFSLCLKAKELDITQLVNSKQLSVELVASSKKLIPRQMGNFDLILKYSHDLTVTADILNIDYTKGVATQLSKREYYLSETSKSQSIQVFPSLSGEQEIESIQISLKVVNKLKSLSYAGIITLKNITFNVDEFKGEYSFVSSDVEENLTPLVDLEEVKLEKSDALVFEYELSASDTSISMIRPFRFIPQEGVSFYYEEITKLDRFDRGSAKSILKSKITVVFDRGGEVSLVPRRISYVNPIDSEIIESSLEPVVVNISGLYITRYQKLALVILVIIFFLILYIVRIYKLDIANYYENLRRIRKKQHHFDAFVKNKDAIGLLNFLYKEALRVDKLKLDSCVNEIDTLNQLLTALFKENITFRTIDDINWPKVANLDLNLLDTHNQDDNRLNLNRLNG